MDDVEQDPVAVIVIIKMKGMPVGIAQGGESRKGERKSRTRPANK